MHGKLTAALIAAVAAVSTMSAAPAGDDCAGGARQIPDPLSPVCRGTTWDQPNGGATWTGVDGDSITLVLYNDFGISGDMNAPWTPEDEGGFRLDDDTRVPVPAHLTDFQHRYLVRTIKAHVRSLKRTFQTYGRDVRVIAQASGAGLSSSCAERRGDAANSVIESDPFAAIAVGSNMECYADQLAFYYGRMTLGTLEDTPRRIFGDDHPYVWSLFPDLETEAALSASFICDKLHDRPARLTGDPRLEGRTRTFGLLYPTESIRGDYAERAALALQQAVLAGCGMEFDQVLPFFGGGQPEAAALINRLREEEITTVVCYCVPVPSENTVLLMQTHASLQNYEPEWYFDHVSRMDKAVWHQTFTTRFLQPSFGSSVLWRMPALRDQHHYRAYLEEEPGTTPNERFSWLIYHALLQAFTAIQEAGPFVDPPAVASGLAAHSFRDLDDPWTPTGGYDARESHTFIDSGMAWWWDPLGTTPGDPLPAQGCIRVANDGRRSYAGGWPEGDADLYFSGDPCTGPPHNAYP